MHFSKTKRRGRPHLNHPMVDKGTTELCQKKKDLINKGNDLTLAESLLGILYAHHLIARPLFEAGQFFGELGWRYQPCLGYNFRSRSFSPTFTQSKKTHDSFFTEKEEMARTRAWRGALSVLRTTGLSSYHAVLRVVFYEYDLYEDSFLRALKSHINPLHKGLTALDLYFRGELKGTVNKRSYQAQGPEKATKPLPVLKESPPAFLPEYSSQGYPVL